MRLYAEVEYARPHAACYAVFFVHPVALVFHVGIVVNHMLLHVVPMSTHDAERMTTCMYFEAWHAARVFLIVKLSTGSSSISFA